MPRAYLKRGKSYGKENTMDKYTREQINGIGAHEAAKVKKALDEERLSQKWLLYRLDCDYGLKLVNAQLSETLSCKRAVGSKTQTVIFRSMQIIDKYRSVFPRKK